MKDECEECRQDNRKKILDTALNLFTTKGFHATPTSAIYKKAGLASGTLFYYFPDKQTLIEELYLSVKREMAEVFIKADDKNLPIKERIEKIMWCYILWGINNPEKEQFMVLFCNSPNIGENVRREAHLQFEWTHDLIREGIKSGILADINIEIYQIFLFRTASGIFQLIRNGDTGLSPKELFRQNTRLFWNGALNHEKC